MQAVTARLSVTKRAIAVRDTKDTTERAKRSDSQSEPPQEAHQRAARELQPIENALNSDPARMPLFGDLIMRKPTLLLAELIGHSRHKVLRPRDSGLGGRNRVERIACTSHVWCSLTRAQGDPRRYPAPYSRACDLRRFPVETPHVSIYAGNPNAKSRCSVPGIPLFQPVAWQNRRVIRRELGEGCGKLIRQRL